MFSRNWLFKICLSSKSNALNRLYSSTGYKLTYSEFGNPLDVLRKEEYPIPEPSKNEVLVAMLASPMNPVDINIIQGKYSPNATLPSVPGYEGVGKVVKLGPGVSNSSLKVGSHVVFQKPNVGTWRTHLTVASEDVRDVPKNLDIAQAATLSLNPCTAYAMLKNFVDLKFGDTIIQNGANSACGQLAIQLCKLWKINSVNIIRNRPKIDELKSMLKHLGATVVLTEEELSEIDVFKEGLSKPKLALNCVSGKSVTNISRYLEASGTVVTYGGMSKEPIIISTSSLIFKDLRYLGFNLTTWNKEAKNKVKKEEMLKDVCSMFLDGQLNMPSFVYIPLDDYGKAVDNVLKGMTSKKFIIKFNENNV